MHERERFNCTAAPFDRLTAAQQALLQELCSVQGFEAGDVLQTPEMQPTHVYLLRAGRVQRQRGAQVLGVHGPGELIAVRPVLGGSASSSWVALDAGSAWRIPKNAFQALIAQNAGFCGWVFAEVARRLGEAPSGGRPAALAATPRRRWWHRLLGRALLQPPKSSGRPT